MTQWNSDRERTIIDIRKGGAGGAWLMFSTQGEISAPSGGGQSVESRWGRGANGLSEPKGTILTSNPERFTFDLSDRLDPAKARFLEALYRCPFDVRVRQYCDDINDMTAFEAIIGYIDGYTTSRTYSTTLANNAATPGDDTMETYNMSAITEFRLRKLVHLNITKTNVDAAINKIILAGAPRCTGDCGLEQNGEEKFWSVTDADSTPGYFGEPTAQFGYTVDSMNTPVYSYINVYQNANATGLVKNGKYAIVASPEGGIAYARYSDIVDGIAAPWTLAHYDAGNNARVLVVDVNGTIWAAGDNGYIYRSLDGGFTWETVDAGVSTSENILSIAAAGETIWFGAENGVLLQYTAGSISSVSSGVSAHINTLAVPEGRERELYFGTAGGRIYRSTDVQVSTPVFAELSLDGAGSGSVDDIQFAGYKGNVMFVVQSNAAGKSRVIRDLSGGYMGQQAEIIASYNSPDQNGINSIAPANENFAISVGELVGGYGFIGKLSAAS